MSKCKLTIPKETTEQGSKELPKKKEEENQEKPNHTLISTNVSKRRKYQQQNNEKPPKTEDVPKQTSTNLTHEDRRKNFYSKQPPVAPSRAKITDPSVPRSNVISSNNARSRGKITTITKTTEIKTTTETNTKSQYTRSTGPEKVIQSSSRRNIFNKKENISPLTYNINSYRTDDKIEKIIFIQRWWRDFLYSREPQMIQRAMRGNNKYFVDKSLKIADYMDENEVINNNYNNLPQSVIRKKGQKITECFSPSGNNKLVVETKKVEVYQRQNRTNYPQSQIIHSKTDTLASQSPKIYQTLKNIPLREIKNFLRNVWNEENSCSTVESLCCYGEENRDSHNIPRNEIIDEYENEIHELKNILIQKDQEINNLINDLSSTQNIMRTKKEFINTSCHDFEQDAHEIQIISTKQPWNRVIQPFPVNEIFIASNRNDIPLFMQEVESIMILGDIPGNMNISTERSHETNSERWSNGLLRQNVNGLEIITDERRVLEIQKVNELDITAVVIRPMNICQHLETLAIYGNEKEDSFSRELCRIQELEGLEILVAPKLPYEKQPLINQKISSNVHTETKTEMIQELDGLEVIKSSHNVFNSSLLFPEAVNEVAIFGYSGSRNTVSSGVGRKCMEYMDSMSIIALPRSDLYVEFIDNFEINRDYDMLLVKPTWNSLQVQGSGLNLLAIPRDMRLENQEVDDFEIHGLEKPDLLIQYMDNFSFNKSNVIKGIKIYLPLADNEIQNLESFILPATQFRTQRITKEVIEGENISRTQVVFRDFNEVNDMENVENLDVSKAYSAKILIPLYNNLEIESFNINLEPIYPRGQVVIHPQEGGQGHVVKVIEEIEETHKQIKQSGGSNNLINSFDSKKLKKSLRESFLIEKTGLNISSTPLDWNNINNPIRTTKLTIQGIKTISTTPILSPSSSTVWLSAIKPVKTTKLYVKPTVSPSRGGLTSYEKLEYRDWNSVNQPEVILTLTIDKTKIRTSIYKPEELINKDNNESPHKNAADFIQEGFAINLISDVEKVYNNNSISDTIELYIPSSYYSIGKRTDIEKVTKIEKQKEVISSTSFLQTNWNKQIKPATNKGLQIISKVIKKKTQIELRPYRGERLMIKGTSRSIIIKTGETTKKVILRIKKESTINIIGRKIEGSIRSGDGGDSGQKVTITKTTKQQIISSSSITDVNKNWNISNRQSQENDIRIFGRKKQRIIYAQEAIKSINFFGSKKRYINWNITNRAQRNTKFDVGGYKKKWKLDVGNGANVFIRTSNIGGSLEDETIINDDYNCNEFHEPMLKRGVKAFVYRVKTEEEKDSSTSSYDALLNVKIQSKYMYQGQAQYQHYQSRKDRRSSGQVKGNAYINMKGTGGTGVGGNDYKIVYSSNTENVTNGKYQSKVVESSSYKEQITSSQKRQHFGGGKNGYERYDMKVKTTNISNNMNNMPNNMADTGNVVMTNQYISQSGVNSQPGIINKNVNINKVEENSNMKINITHTENQTGYNINNIQGSKNSDDFQMNDNQSNIQERTGSSGLMGSNNFNQNNNIQMGFSQVNEGGNKIVSGNRSNKDSDGQENSKDIDENTQMWIKSSYNNVNNDNIQNNTSNNMNALNGLQIREQIVIPSITNEISEQRNINIDSGNNIENFSNYKQIYRTSKSTADLLKKKGIKIKKTEPIRDFYFQGQ